LSDRSCPLMLSITAWVKPDGTAMGPVSRPPNSVKRLFVLSSSGPARSGRTCTGSPHGKRRSPPKTGKPPPKRGLSLERRLRKDLQRVVAVARPEQRTRTRAPKGPCPPVLSLRQNHNHVVIEHRHDCVDRPDESRNITGHQEITAVLRVLVKACKLASRIFLDQFRPVACAAGP